ncbi:MAG: HEAT repeat domain-containing protein [Chloroflexi bacterium]|nr:HEAT repeat domain-containing protein [Chloroflexota bacterium]MCL5110210.1 HEAT repeat domain-containing protein [Chloroflexota bacterium]
MRWVTDLDSRAPETAKAMHVLLYWLPRARNYWVKFGILRALSAKWAKPAAARPLVDEFERGEDPTGFLKWQVAAALSVVADDTVFGEITSLAQDRRHGRAREMLMLALANMRNPQAVEVLIELLDDEEVAGHAVMALGKLRAQAARPYIEPFLAHSKAWVRREARKALAKIDKARQAG